MNIQVAVITRNSHSISFQLLLYANIIINYRYPLGKPRWIYYERPCKKIQVNCIHKVSVL